MCVCVCARVWLYKKPAKPAKPKRKRVACEEPLVHFVKKKRWSWGERRVGGMAQGITKTKWVKNWLHKIKCKCMREV